MPTRLEELTLCSTEVHLLFFLDASSARLFLKNIIAQNGEAYAARTTTVYIYLASALTSTPCVGHSSLHATLGMKG